MHERFMVQQRARTSPRIHERFMAGPGETGQRGELGAPYHFGSSMLGISVRIELKNPSPLQEDTGLGAY